MVNESINLYAKSDGYRARYDAWYKIMEYMGTKAGMLFPFVGNNFDMSHMSWTDILNGPFTNERKMHDVADYLAKNILGRLEVITDYDYGAPLMVNDKTIIREYRMKTQGGVVREAYNIPGSPYIWAANVHEDKLIRLNPGTGEKKSYDVPYDMAIGLHTLTADKYGKLWIGTVENSTLTRFDHKTEKWDFWRLDKNQPGFPKIPHDIAFDSDFLVKYDNNGKIWMSIITNNSLMSLDPKTGNIEEFEMPRKEGQARIAPRMYGIVMSGDGKHVWYSQLFGDVGCFNTETHKLETVIDMQRWENPRRLAITENGILYIPLFGAGQIVKYDTEKRKKIAVYDLPDRSSAPYAVTWDKKRRVVWVATTSTDVIYRFDPETEKFGVLPLPRQNAYLRMIALDPVTNDLISAYSSYDHLAIEDPPSFVFSINPGDRNE
jgi:streptogramin lyase